MPIWCQLHNAQEAARLPGNRSIGAHEAKGLVNVAGYPTGLVITRDAEEISSQQQRQGGSSAKAAGSAGLAEHSGPLKKQAGSASSRRFTPAQQAVAAALMVVLKRAMKGGREAVLSAKLSLAANNPATQPLLKSLPDDGPLPTMQQVEQKASKQLRESLAKLAKQCESAGCKPLEVFTRSAQCARRREGTQRTVKGVMSTAQQYMLSNMPQPDGICQGTVHFLQHLGVQESVARFIVTLMHFVARQQNPANRATGLAESDLDHTLPGELQLPLLGRSAFAECLCHLAIKHCRTHSRNGCS